MYHLGLYIEVLERGNKGQWERTKEKYSLNIGDIVETKDIVSQGKKIKSFIKVEDFNKIKITYEDENMLLVEKWPGVLVHSDKKIGEPTLTDYVLTYLWDKGDYIPENEITFTPAPCNRLDRNTSGIVIFGKNYEALKELNEMIRERRIRKYYQALVSGRIKDGIYEGYISKDNEKNISIITEKKNKDSKKVAMQVKTLQCCGTFSLIEIELITGRSHQLRAHLSYLGNPIVGDNKYGKGKMNSFFYNRYGISYQYLYAYKVIFKNCTEKLKYMDNKTIAETLPPVLKKIKNDVFKF